MYLFIVISLYNTYILLFSSYLAGIIALPIIIILYTGNIIITFIKQTFNPE